MTGKERIPVYDPNFSTIFPAHVEQPAEGIGRILQELGQDPEFL